MEDKSLIELNAELKILADINRLGILKFLKKRKQASVGEIADSLKISFKATSKHLLFLVRKGILVNKKDGPFVIYYISNNLSLSIRSVIDLI